MRITVFDDYQDSIRRLPCYAKLAGHEVTIWNDHTKDVDQLADRLKDTEALALFRERTPITAPLLAKLGRLRLISQVGVVPHIDLAACTRYGVLVSSRIVPGHPSYATAELAWGLIIAAMRRIPEEAASLKRGQWQSRSGLGDDLRGKTLGIYGYGRIGSVVAGYGCAFGMKVLAWGRTDSLARARADQVEAAGTETDLFERSDVLSVHLGLNDNTHSLITLEKLSAMKTTALFVNVSRAQLVADQALVDALRAGRPGRAAVDVFEDEPAPADHPLLALPNVLATPHLGFVTRNSLEGMFSTVFEQILDYAAGRPLNVLNPAALRSP